MYKSLRTRSWIAGVTAVGVVAFLYPFVIPPERVEEEEVVVADKPSEPVPDFKRFKNVREKKQAFFRYLRPEVEKQNELILNQRSFIIAMRDRLRNTTPEQTNIESGDVTRLREIAAQYKVPSEKLDNAFFKRLLRRVDIIPVPLVLVQAANESAWGTSRFAREGYNFFGMWCFSKGCGFVPKRRDDDMNHEVARFKSLSEGVRRYLTNLNRHYAYSDLRYIREVLRQSQQPITAELLAEGLLHYSERGQAYVEELQAMIRVNEQHMEVDDFEDNLDFAGTPCNTAELCE